MSPGVWRDWTVLTPGDDDKCFFWVKSIIYKLFPSSLLSVFNVCCEIMTSIIEWRMDEYYMMWKTLLSGWEPGDVEE